MADLSSFYWDIVVECLVKLHGKTHEEAFNLMVDLKRNLREAGDEVLEIAYNEEPFNVACKLAENELDWEGCRVASNEIQERHYGITAS